MFCKFFYHTTSAFYQVLDSAGRRSVVPVIADGIVRKHVHMRGLAQLVALTGIADAFNTRSLHVFRQPNNVGILTRPVAALPKFPIRAFCDQFWVPSGTALIGIVVVVRKSNIAVGLARIL